jgi:hypothetical protein
MPWRKLLWGAFWALCSVALLVKMLAAAGKGLFVVRHLWDWWPHALAAVAIFVIIAALLDVWSRRSREPA